MGEYRNVVARGTVQRSFERDGFQVDGENSKDVVVAVAKPFVVVVVVENINFRDQRFVYQGVGGTKDVQTEHENDKGDGHGEGGTETRVQHSFRVLCGEGQRTCLGLKCCFLRQQMKRNERNNHLRNRQ